MRGGGAYGRGQSGAVRPQGHRRIFRARAGAAWPAGGLAGGRGVPRAPELVRATSAGAGEHRRPSRRDHQLQERRALPEQWRRGQGHERACGALRRGELRPDRGTGICRGGPVCRCGGGSACARPGRVGGASRGPSLSWPGLAECRAARAHGGEQRRGAAGRALRERARGRHGGAARLSPCDARWPRAACMRHGDRRWLRNGRWRGVDVGDGGSA